MVAPSPGAVWRASGVPCVAWGRTEKGGQAASGPGTWEIDSDSWHLPKDRLLGKRRFAFWFSV